MDIELFFHKGSEGCHFELQNLSGQHSLKAGHHNLVLLSLHVRHSELAKDRYIPSKLRVSCPVLF